MLPPQVSPNSSPRLLRTLHFLCSDGGRMLSLQDQRNPDVHDANSAWEWPLAVILETDTLCCTIFLPTSWIPRSRCMSQVKCCKGWLRWIVSDRTAINPFFWAAFKLHQYSAFSLSKSAQDLRSSVKLVWRAGSADSGSQRVDRGDVRSKGESNWNSDCDTHWLDSSIMGENHTYAWSSDHVEESKSMRLLRFRLVLGANGWQIVQKRIKDGKLSWRIFDSPILTECQLELMENRLSSSGMFAQDSHHCRFSTRFKRN